MIMLIPILLHGAVGVWDEILPLLLAAMAILGFLLAILWQHVSSRHLTGPSVESSRDAVRSVTQPAGVDAHAEDNQG